MKSVFKHLAATAVLVATALAQDGYVINTPGPQVICRPLRINWSGGTPPYFLTLHPGAAPDAPALMDFGQIDANFYTWVVNVEPGSYGLRITDSTGDPRQTAAFQVDDGPDDSCLDDDGGSPPPPPSGSSSSAVPPSSSSGGTPPSSSSPRPPPSSSNVPSRSNPPTPSSSAPADDDDDSDDDSAASALKLGPAVLVALAGAAAVLA